MPKLRMRQAIARALHDELTSDPDVILLGEDIAAAGGVFKATEGLLETFGPKRVRDTPISEMGFLGAALGAAATGLRPVVEIMFIEFIGVALDQLVTQAAKFRFLSRGTITVPLTVRASVGAGQGFGCQHSQTLENWFRATPGLKLVVPSGPQTAYGLLRAAIRDQDPVVVLEPRALYGERAEVVLGDEGIIPIGRAEVVAEGDAVTVVTAGQMLGPVLTAAADYPGRWEVIDLRTLVPWDRETVTTSVARTGRLVVVEEAPWSGGWGSEITDHIAGELFRQLKAPPHRITTPDAPVPHAEVAERWFLPSPTYIRDQVTELIETGARPKPWWRDGALT